MARGENQKLKALYIMKILLEKTDENHGISMSEIIKELEKYDVTAERKSVYTDIDLLCSYGLDIIGEKKDRKFVYYIGMRDFELAELKLLVDAVQSSKFITERKSRELIKKLEGLTSLHEAKRLQRQVYVSGRVKTMNESIYYNVDKIHAAINNNMQIKFLYFGWNEKKEMVLRQNGELYHVSPWGLLWDDENYYLVGYDSKAQSIKYYRVDKMQKISHIESPREGREHFEHLNMAEYTRKRFGMFNGEEELVHLEFKNAFAGVVIDRFGKDVTFQITRDGYFEIHVKVAISRQFFGWLFALGDGVRVIGPDTVLDKIREEVTWLSDTYTR